MTIEEKLDRVLVIEEKIDKQEFMLYRLLKGGRLPIDYLTIQDIAHLMQISEGILRKRPWMLPNYGKSDLGERPKRYKCENYLEWIKTSTEEHKRAWDAMSEMERREAVGKAS